MRDGEMGQCPFYRSKEDTYRSRALRGDYVQSVQTVTTPWCTHIHSPVTEADTRGLGGAAKLECGGSLTRCPLSLELFAADPRAPVR
jgi:hypothetical protein